MSSTEGLFCEKHCLSCIKIDCKETECPVVKCKLACGARYHGCKSTEHLLLCPSERVACLNAGNGCPKILLRHRMADHIQYCPASIVVCSAEWTRIPRKKENFKYELDYTNDNDSVLFRGKTMGRRYFRSIKVNENSKALDVAHALHNQDHLIEARFPEQPPLFRTTEMYFDYDGTKLVSKERIYVEKGPIYRDYEMMLHTIASYRKFNTSPLKKLHFNSGLEFMARDAKHPANSYTYSCMEILRRNEFANHFSSLHGIILPGLDGWMEEKCPLSSLGCEYSHQRLHPINDRSTVTFNAQIGKFAVKHDSTTLMASSSDEVISKEHDSTKNLLTFPSVVLEHIIGYLDSYSIYMLSRTCSQAREICEGAYLKRGMVLQEWRKNENAWKQYSESWTFSFGFSSIEDWVPHPNGKMANHLSACPFNERSIPVPAVPALTSSELIPEKFRLYCLKLE